MTRKLLSPAGPAGKVLNRLPLSLRGRLALADPTFRSVWPEIDSVEGLLVSPIQEAWLFETARALSEDATIVEIGSYRGRSTVALAFACRGTRRRVYAIDTFDGNEADFGERDFFDAFSSNVQRLGLEGHVVPLRGRSAELTETWNGPIDLLYIDGSHVYEDVVRDFESLFPSVLPGGIVALHDVFDGYPGVLRAWEERVKDALQGIGFCSTLAYGRKPPTPTVPPIG